PATGDALPVNADSTETLEARQLRRSRSDRTLAGVCGGLAAYFEIHPAVFRVAFVVLTLMGGAGILIYLAAALVLPDEGKQDSVAAAALRRRRPWVLVVLGLAAVVPLALLSEVPVWPRGDAWVFILVAAAILLWLTWFAVAATRSGWLRAVVIAVSSAVVLLLALMAAFLAVFDVHLRDGIAERTFAPASVDTLRDEYELGIGELVLDLRSIEFPLGETRLRARVDAGRIHLLLPDGVALRAGTSAKLGEIELLGRGVEGWEVARRVDETGLRVLVVDAEVGIGEIQIERGLR
ncbi:MAG TPA: PspC domain-containing protein, partial [Gaiellaceae bacterium]|nr:PspC domain-containing protein [Gaiellaceae bacterium]